MSKEPRPGLGRRILGWVLVGLGALSILDFPSPIPIPTVGASAIISGLILIGASIVVLNRHRWAALLQGAAGGSRPRIRKPVDAMVPVAVLRLAKERAGELTVSAVAIGLGVSLDTAEAALEECVARGAAAKDFDEKHAVVVYRFSEFLPPATDSQES